MARNILYIIYGISNFLYAIVSVYILLFAETYLNGFLIPRRFLWNNDGTKRQHPIVWGIIENTILLCLEGILLLVVIYLFDKWFLTNFVKTDKANILSKWTVGIIAIYAGLFIGSLTIGFYFPLPF